MEEELKLKVNEVFTISELKDLSKYECTPEICAAKVRQFAWALEYVPEEYKTPEMCRRALESSVIEGYGHLLLLPHIPFTEVCMEALERWGAQGGYKLKELTTKIRPEVFDEKMADYLVTKNGHCLELLPIHLQTKERAEKAVKVSGAAAILSNRVRPELKTPDLWLECARHSWSSFCVIPWRERSPETCLMAYLKFPDMMKNCPQIVPSMIQVTCNVYSLCKLMEQITSEKFSFRQMKEFYDGKPMAVKRMEIPQGFLNIIKEGPSVTSAKRMKVPQGFLKDREVTFDKQTGKLRFAPLQHREEQEQGKELKKSHRQLRKEVNKNVPPRRIGRKM